jgi:hypothetical protein
MGAEGVKKVLKDDMGSRSERRSGKKATDSKQFSAGIAAAFHVGMRNIFLQSVLAVGSF